MRNYNEEYKREMRTKIKFNANIKTEQQKIAQEIKETIGNPDFIKRALIVFDLFPDIFDLIELVPLRERIQKIKNQKKFNEIIYERKTKPKSKTLTVKLNKFAYENILKKVKTIKNVNFLSRAYILYELDRKIFFLEDIDIQRLEDRMLELKRKNITSFF